jgi:hypothetical protein
LVKVGLVGLRLAIINQLASGISPNIIDIVDIVGLIGVGGWGLVKMA